MNLTGLQRRLTLIAANLEQRKRPAAVQQDGDPFEHLTEQERAELETFLDSIKDKIASQAVRPLQGLSDQELDILHRWLELALALREDDTDTAARCRRWLNNSPLQQRLTYLVENLTVGAAV